MADTTWNSSDGNMNVDTSYTGSKPGAGDRLFFTKGLGVVPSSNLDFAAALQLLLVSIPKGMGYDIGSSGNPLELSVDQLSHFGDSKLWFKDGGTGTTALIVVKSDSDPTNEGSSADISGGNAVTNILVLKGNVVISGPAGGHTRVEVGYVNNPLTDARVKINSGVGAVVTLDQWGGVVDAENAITTYNQYAGHLIKTTAAITTWNQGRGATAVYDTGATITTLRQRGRIDFGKNRAQTVTTRWIYPGAKVDGDANLLTVTTDNDHRGEL